MLVTLLSASVADAVPGRSWAPIQRLDHANHSVMRAEFFSASRGDSLELVAIGFEGVTPFRFYGLVWQDSAWMERWHADAAPLAYVRPVDDRVGRSFVWIHPDALTEDCGTPSVRDAPVVFASREGDSLSMPDTVACIRNITAAYQSGARSSRVAWVVSEDRLSSQPLSRRLAIFSRRQGGEWVQFAPESAVDAAPDIVGGAAVLSDTTAMLAWTRSQSQPWGGLWTGVVNSEEFVWRPTKLHNSVGLAEVHLRPDGAGGLALATSPDNDTLGIVFRYHDGAWSAPDTVRWTLPFAGPFNTYITDASRDFRLLPAVTATSYSNLNGRLNIHVAVPDGDRYPRGEMIAGSDNGLDSRIQRDRNGDVWVAWRIDWNNGLMWTHTYTSATCSTPVLGESAGAPRITFALSERTPESVWSVLRSADGGAFERIGEVRAIDDTLLAYVDTTAPPSASLRYRIRRECLDVRYLWLSEPSAEWLPRTPRLGLSLQSLNPATHRIEIDVTGAAGESFEADLLDLQGRVVARQRLQSSGTGRDRVAFDLGATPALRAGVYLVRVRSRSGVTSAGLKVAILR